MSYDKVTQVNEGTVNMVIFAGIHMTYTYPFAWRNWHFSIQPFLRIAWMYKWILNKLSVWIISKILMLFNCFKELYTTYRIETYLYGDQ